MKTIYYRGAFLMVLLSVFSCKKDNKPRVWNVCLDNPSKFPIVVAIDSLNRHPLQGGEMKYVSLSEGNHRFYTWLHDTVLLANGEFQLTQDGFLNTTRSLYVLWREKFYTQNPEAAHQAMQLPDTVVRIEGRNYWGDIELLGGSDIFIPRKWDYDVLTPFSDSVPISNKEEVIIKAKLFRKRDFITEYASFTDTSYQRIADSLVNVYYKDTASIRKNFRKLGE